jgi:hypothetical protein
LAKKIVTYVFIVVIDGKEQQMKVQETDMVRARAKLILQGIYVKTFLYTE